jgi:hypothetical protein
MARRLTFRASYRTVALLAVLALCLGGLALAAHEPGVRLTPAFKAIQAAFEPLAIVLAVLAAALLALRLRKSKPNPETFA